MLLHRALGDPQPPGDAGVGAALGHQGEHLPLPRAEGGKGVVPVTGRHQLGHQRRVDHRPALGDPLEGVDELLHVGDAALEQVPDPPAAGQQLHGVVDLDMGRQDQDAGLRVLLADLPGRLQALGGVGRGHADVDHHQLGWLRVDEGQELAGVAGLAGHLEAGAFQEAGQALSEQDVVVGQDHPQAMHRHAWGLWSSLPL
jgi:hypothetical protein